MQDANPRVTPTINVVIHRPILSSGANGWGIALLHAYQQSVKSGINKNVRIISAPPIGNIPTKDNVSYHEVPIDKSVYLSAKARAVDLYAWDLIHHLRNGDDEPFAVTDLASDMQGYRKTWKDFFVFSIAAANTSLELAYQDGVPVFHLNDPHDSFASALFEGNYDEQWLLNTIGSENKELFNRFISTKQEFLSRHGSINHMRFWHVPSIEVEAWQSWFKRDPDTARHFLAGVLSSPLIVHSPEWKTDFDELIDVALPELVEYFETDRSRFLNGVGVGPIGYDRTSFAKRFEKHDPTGDLSGVKDQLENWASSIRSGVGDKEPIVFFLTCRGDDPKNNLPKTVRALKNLALSNPDALERMAVIAVYSTSRTDEHAIYGDTLKALDHEFESLQSVIGKERAIVGLTENGDLTYQTAGFMLSNSFVCAARGGFDIVGVEACVVAAIKANGGLDECYNEILNRYGFDNSFHLVTAQSAGSSAYLNSVLENFTMIDSPGSLMPTSDLIEQSLNRAWDSLDARKSFIRNGHAVLSGIDEICSGPACIDQWTSAAIEGNPQNHLRTHISTELVNTSLDALKAAGATASRKPDSNGSVSDLR